MSAPTRARSARAVALAAVSAVLLAVTVPAVSASAVTHSVTAPLLIRAHDAGPASPYPGVIDLDAPGEVISSVSVSIIISHEDLGYVDMVLRAPDGSSVMLLSDAGCSQTVYSTTLTFSDDATDYVPVGGPVLSNGTYRPTNIESGTCGRNGDNFPEPGPSAWGSTLATLAGGPADGEWELFVVNQFSSDTGLIRWTLDVETVDVAPTITSAAAGAGAVGSPFSHTFAATGVPAPTFTYTDVSLPDGVTLVGDTLAGTPTEAGDFEVTATASNGVSPNAVQTFELSVEAAPAVAIALAPGQSAVTNASPVEFAVTFDEAPVGFDASDVVLGGTATGGVAALAGSGTDYSVSVAGFTDDGTVSLSIPAGAWADADGYLGAAASGPEVTFDTTAPEIAVPVAELLQVTTDPGQPGAVVNYAPGFTDARVGPAAVASSACSPSSGSFFAIGVTTVDCTATDEAGNTATASFDVTVVDDEAPVIGAVEDIAVQLADGESSAVVDFDEPSATDNSGTATVTCDLAPGAALGEGSRTVTCTAEDPSGNRATSQFDVTVLAVDAPDEDEPVDEDEPGEDDEVTEDDEELADTGSDPSSLALGALTLIAMGGALLIASQRRGLRE